MLVEKEHFAFLKLIKLETKVLMKTAIIILSIFIISCSTIYKTEGYGGGYTSMPLGNDRYYITARGNAYTSMHKVQMIAFVRAADVALTNGFPGFIIEEKSAWESTGLVSNRGQIMSYSKPFYEFVIQAVDTGDYIDSQSVIDENRAYVNYRGPY